MILASAETISLNGFTAIIKRTRRQGSVGFRLSGGQVVVLAPKSITNKQLKGLLTAKSDWILSKLTALDEVPIGPVRLYQAGDRLPYLGDELTLVVRPGAFGVELKMMNQLVVSAPQAKPDWIRNALVRWYKQQAKDHFRQRVAFFAPLVGAWPTEVEIKTYRARWGSCNLRGEVQFNWKLMMAPQAVVDSVVVHELCHLLHMHHGPEFWSHVSKVLPNHRDAKQWLKEEGHLLGLD
ncbi:MAG: SprT family zinc-dependent metalloprotease [Gammaproteobacteria bacterium]|nr:SprT family zinc-dependent metalloprotease [Gammaproteobacteria bacterium]